MRYWKSFLINLQFFTMIPVPIKLPMDKHHLSKAVKTFPLLGLLQGIMHAFLIFAFIQWSPFSILSISFFLWVTMILLTGGIHLDGWMDTSDAYFSYRNIEERLKIMNDPRIGAFGVLSVLVLLSSKFLFMFEVMNKLTFASYLLIALVPFLSKGLMGLLLIVAFPAKREGLASLFRSAVDRTTYWFYLTYLTIILSLLSLLNIELVSLALILIGVTILCLFLFRIKCMKWFGGITGDVLGASVEGVELVLWMTIWLLHYFVMG